MTRSARPVRPGRPFRRIVMAALVAGLILAIAVACVPALRERTALALARPALVAKLAKSTGLEVRLASVGREDGRLALDGLELVRPGEERRVVFETERLQLDVTPFELLRYGAAGVRSWTLIAPRVRLDSGGGSSGWLAGLKNLEHLEVRSGSLEMPGLEAKRIDLTFAVAQPAELSALFRLRPDHRPFSSWTQLTFGGRLDERRRLLGAGELVPEANPQQTLVRFEQFDLDLLAALGKRLDLTSDLVLNRIQGPADCTVRLEASTRSLRLGVSTRNGGLSQVDPLLEWLGGIAPTPLTRLGLSGQGLFELALQADARKGGGYDLAGGRGTLALDLQGVRLRNEPMGAVEAKMRLAGGQLEVNHASVRGQDGVLDVRDLRLALEKPGSVPRSGAVSLHGAGLARRLASGAGLSFGNLDQVDLELRFDERRADLKQFEARGDFGHVRFAPSSTEFAGGARLDLRGVGALDARYLVRTLSALSPLAERLHAGLPVNELAFDAQLEGTLSDPRASLQLRSPEGSEAQLSADLRLEPRAFELVALSFDQPGASARWSGLLSAPPPEAAPAERGLPFAPAASWSLVQLAGQAEWTRPHPLSGPLASGRFAFNLDGSDPATLEFGGSAELLEAGQVSLRTRRPGSSLELQFASCLGPRVLGELDLTGPLERLVHSPLGASFQELQVPLSGVALFGQSRLELLRSREPVLVQVSRRGSWQLPPLDLSGPLGQLQIEATSESGPVQAGSMHATHVDLALLADLLPGQLPFDLQGRLGSGLWVREAQPGKAAETLLLEASDLDVGRAGLAAQLELRAESAGGSEGLQVLELSLREPRAGSLVLERATLAESEPPTWTGALDLDLDAALIDRWSSSDDAWWQALAVSWVGATADAQLRIGEAVELESGQVQLPGRGLYATLAGSLGIPQRSSATSAGPLSIRWKNWLNAWSEAPIQLTADGRIEDLGLIAGALPELRSAGGSAQFTGVQLGGTLKAPRGSGSLTVKDASLKFEGSLPALDELSLEAKLAGDTFSVTDLSGQLASAPIRANGSVTFPDQGEPQLRVVLEGQDVLLARSRDLRLRGDVNLLLSGPPSDPRLEGEIQLQRSRYARSLPVLSLGMDALRRPFENAARERGFVPFSIRTAPWDNVRFDVRVTAEEPLRLENNLYQGGLVPDLRLEGTSRQPELIGRVFLEPGVVALPASKLRIAGGTVRFDATDPFVPQLDVYGESRVRGYDLAVSITGPYDDPSVRVSSVPPLPPGDALVLLTTGQLTAQALSEEGSAQTARLLAVYLVQDLGASLFGGSEGGSLLDRLEIVKGQEIAADGTETFEASWRLDQNLLFEGDQLRLVGEYDRFQEVNFGLRFLWRFR